MIKFPYLLTLLGLILSCSYIHAQVRRDLDKSVPVWLEYDSDNNASLRWIEDDIASTYQISTLDQNTEQLTLLANLTGDETSYDLGQLDSGELQYYHLDKDQNGKGIITVGLDVPPVHYRGRCMIAIDELLTQPLQAEIIQLMHDMRMDGWEVDTATIERRFEPPAIKGFFNNWYDENYTKSQSILILGHVPIPYSGNSAYDGHNNHQGAWVADSYYGDVDGNWTDVSVNNVTPSRDINKNVPGDGKFDQSLLPSPIEIEVGRVDFHDLPVFDLDEIELTRKYLNKNHQFRMGSMDYPRRAFVDNNFPGFAEGFGQTGWKNFPTMFGADSVSIRDYDVLVDNKYLCSYACGAGSYTSCGGVGTTENVWARRDNQTVFTFTFGSYFGDWDIRDNFLRSALGSGDVLTNAWAGRPSWHIFPMALGQHIGYCTRLTQNASDEVYGQGFAARTAHVSLLGDPTLRLHSVKPVGGIELEFEDGNMIVEWKPSPDETDGYIIYKKSAETNWRVLEEFYASESFVDECLASDSIYSYMVKAIKLEHTGSGSYYNTSLGVMNELEVVENTFLQSYFADTDNDGYGDAAEMVQDCTVPTGYVSNGMDCDDSDPLVFPGATEICDGLDNNCDDQIDEGVQNTYYIDLDGDGFGDENQTIEDCMVPSGYSDNNLDCDDTNPAIFPGAEETPDNDIDEDCDGEDLITNGVDDLLESQIVLSPNPVSDFLFVKTDLKITSYTIRNMQGQSALNNQFNERIDVNDLVEGIYLLELTLQDEAVQLIKKFIVQK